MADLHNEINLCEVVNTQYLHSSLGIPAMEDYIQMLSPDEKRRLITAMINKRIEAMDIGDMESTLHEYMHQESMDGPRRYLASDVIDYNLEEVFHEQVIYVLRDRRIALERQGIVNPDEIGDEL